MDYEQPRNIPDLIVRKCPVDDCSQCAMVYINTLIGHRIICRCGCHSLVEEIQERLNNRTSERGPKVSAHQAQAAVELAPKPATSTTTTAADTASVKAGLMVLTDSKDRDGSHHHLGDVGRNLDTNEK
jgi:hypothetical protein